MPKELKAVIDTNLIISACLTRSSLMLSLYNAFVGCRFTPVLSPELQEEIFNVVKKPQLRKYFRAQEIKRFKELIAVDTIMVRPAKKLSVCRDPEDNVILEAALEADADFVVTGDKDLLVLKSFAGIPILTARQFLAVLPKL